MAFVQSSEEGILNSAVKSNTCNLVNVCNFMYHKVFLKAHFKFKANMLVVKSSYCHFNTCTFMFCRIFSIRFLLIKNSNGVAAVSV